ncbi:EAL domain-containing protein [Silvimonas sp.]|uniref:EAL domain-containing protein n=1 Tax=Silvimonas sp. TaxID=2650811 RepID=UPI00284E8663|nr:EAL domain-containing protein [Silvimonas sp.]MDR3426209.1 EAL domain-containing protein [Silvimonas sp.]
MHKRLAIGLIALIAIAAIIGPIFAALSLARTRGLQDQRNEALRLATTVLARADGVAQEFFSAHDQLMRAGASNPCSEENMVLMRRLAFSSSHLRAIAYIANNRLVCSSIGPHADGVYIGLPDIVTPRGVAIRKSVKLPFAADYDVRISSMDGYAAIMAQDAALDIDTHVKGMLLSVFYTGFDLPIASNGSVNPAWLAQLKSGDSVSFLEGNYVVALHRSARYNLVGVAAVPVVYLTQNVRKLALFMVPLGAATAILLIAVLVYIARHQTTLQTMMRTALKRQEFSLVYQPVIDLHTGRWVAAEALIRWRRLNGEVIPPDVFIPEAERTGMITQITERVLSLVAHDISHHFKAFPDFAIGVNLSAADLENELTLSLLYRVIKATGMAPHNLVVEATERGFINAEEARQMINDIRTLGIRVAIDDFGTGYSSLSYLTSMALDHLKIDKSFIDTIGKDAVASHVPGHIIAMARSLNLTVIAEGVETAEQADYLRERGVQFAQGWLFSRALPPAELAQKLNAMDSMIRKMDTL